MANPETNPENSDKSKLQAPPEKTGPEVKSTTETESTTAPSKSEPDVSNPIEAPTSQGETKPVNNPGGSSSTVPNPIDNPQNLPPVVVGVEDKPDVKEPSLPVIGFNLSNFVLCIISGFILLLVIFLFAKEFDASSSIKIPTEANISDSTYAKKIELVRMIQEEKKSYRDFTVQISQMILLNLLLPVLTAILGYIFASNKNKE